jgi:hypothetical protein
MAHGDAREGKWRGNWRMEWVTSTLHTTSEHGVSSITAADAHTSAASSRLNWRPSRFKRTRPFRRKTNSGFSACAITFQTQSTAFDVLLQWSYWQVFFFSRHWTTVGLSQVYWFYVTRLTLRCTSARTLVDLRRCGVAFLGKAFSALVSDTEKAAFNTQLRWIPYHQGHPASAYFVFWCETAGAWVAYCCDKKKGLCKRPWCSSRCNYFVAQPTGCTLLLPESVIGYNREADPTTSPYDSAYN